MPHLEAEISGAAAAILDVFERHNTKLTTLSFESQTHYLSALLTELKESEHSAYIITLNLTTPLVQLESEHKEFETLYSKRNTENSIPLSDPQLSTYVGAVRKALNQTITYIGIVETIKPEALKVIVDEINAAISELAPKVKARKTRSANDDAKKFEPSGQTV
jgi:hypothetical protein